MGFTRPKEQILTLQTTPLDTLDLYVTHSISLGSFNLIYFSSFTLTSFYFSYSTH